MSGRATFGDFATAASTALARAVSLADPATAGWAARKTTAHAREIEQASSKLILILGHYLDHISTVNVPDRPNCLPVG